MLTSKCRDISAVLADDAITTVVLAVPVDEDKAAASALPVAGLVLFALRVETALGVMETTAEVALLVAALSAVIVEPASDVIDIATEETSLKEALSTLTAEPKSDEITSDAEEASTVGVAVKVSLLTRESLRDVTEAETSLKEVLLTLKTEPKNDEIANDAEEASIAGVAAEISLLTREPPRDVIDTAIEEASLTAVAAKRSCRLWKHELAPLMDEQQGL